MGESSPTVTQPVKTCDLSIISRGGLSQEKKPKKNIACNCMKKNNLYKHRIDDEGLPALQTHPKALGFPL